MQDYFDAQLQAEQKRRERLEDQVQEAWDSDRAALAEMVAQWGYRQVRDALWAHAPTESGCTDPKSRDEANGIFREF